jgi:SAM-dependent methyltransferase
VSDPYDALAPHYRDYARRKAAYLEAVDAFILDNLPASRDVVLDVGAGDGVRGVSLAKRMQAKRIVLAEPSSEMARLCRDAGADAVWQCPAQSLPERDERFNVILCLWNVIGHISTPSGRVEALSRMAALLAPGGRLFVDVNNRHNASAYGAWRVAARRLIDAVRPDPARGDAAFDWKIGDKVFPTMGHLFTPREMSILLSRCPLKIITRAAVDYASGTISGSPLRGQLIFILGN